MTPEYQLPRILRETLRRKGMSFQKLSKLSGVPVKTLYHWANGQMPRNLSNLKKVGEVLEMTIEELAFGDKSKQSGAAYELVLYRISESQVREKIESLPEPT